MGFTSIFEAKENVLVVRLFGELDHHESESLRHEWKETMYKNDAQHVLSNLKSVKLMDSSGLGVILGRYKEVFQLGGELLVGSVSRQIKRIFDLSGLFKIVRLEENEENALFTLGVAS